MRVFLFSGHMIDAPGRESPRFPPMMEDTIRNAISGILERYGAGRWDVGVGSAACGSDLLFGEGLLERSAMLRLCLSFPEPEFLAKSVAFAGQNWVLRFHAVTAHAQVDVLPASSRIARITSNPYEQTNLWMLEEARRLGGREIVFICVWDGEGGDGPGGTSHMVQAVEAAGGTVVQINPRSL